MARRDRQERHNTTGQPGFKLHVREVSGKSLRAWRRRFGGARVRRVIGRVRPRRLHPHHAGGHHVGADVEGEGGDGVAHAASDERWSWGAAFLLGDPIDARLCNGDGHGVDAFDANGRAKQRREIVFGVVLGGWCVRSGVGSAKRAAGHLRSTDQG
jgi:hypothetical protein